MVLLADLKTKPIRPVFIKIIHVVVVAVAEVNGCTATTIGQGNRQAVKNHTEKSSI
jgi:hypothetical protein